MPDADGVEDHAGTAQGDAEPEGYTRHFHETIRSGFKGKNTGFITSRI